MADTEIIFIFLLQLIELVVQIIIMFKDSRCDTVKEYPDGRKTKRVFQMRPDQSKESDDEIP